MSLPMALQACVLAEKGYAVHLIDHRGHGRSDGLYGYIPDFQSMIRDANYVFSRAKRQYPAGTKCFYYGESMGGAIALNISLYNPQLAPEGAVLIAPMVKISDSLKPSWIQIQMLSLLAKIFPTATITPVPDLINRCFKRQSLLQRKLKDKFRWGVKPRLFTSFTLKGASDEMEEKISNITVPFLVLHGDEDVVTDPKASQYFHDNAKSVDKTLEIIPGAWHSILEYDGFESPHCQEIMLKIIAWLDQRV
jgi:acylglycerol lipase